ncbi:hypothetical protein BGZ97_000189 [Linnemannia gamsii]|jgi:hypothetical protein|uniref:YitH/HolE acetyltransferase (GNAT) domain-containing protein n=1 Tax=Linnemannia gamsii TaxID=64522 RepID=A0A9P6UJD7_9FUNG|nr:hypothetical protein BGZ97_000189 [Linnemannia gamsii]
MVETSSRQVFHQCDRDQAKEQFFTYCNSEQWNPGHKGNDLEILYNADPKGFFISTVETPTTPASNGTNADTKKQPIKEERVSIISAVRYGEDQGWLGCYIAPPKHRGRGYGLATFNRALEHLTPDTRESIGLDGVMAQIENYRKSGFTEIAWLNERRHGSAVELVETQERELAKKICRNEVDGLVLLPDPNVDLDQLPGIEAQYSGLKRPQFVKDWVQFHANHPEENRVAVAFFSPDKKDEKSGKPLVLGYACVRPATSSYRVGPLYAVNGDVAKKLLVKAAVEIVQAEKKTPLGVPLTFDIDVPDKNPAAIKIFDGLGWKNTFPLLRMWRGKIPECDVNGVFGITFPEGG